MVPRINGKTWQHVVRQQFSGDPVSDDATPGFLHSPADPWFEMGLLYPHSSQAGQLLMKVESSLQDGPPVEGKRICGFS